MSNTGNRQRQIAQARLQPQGRLNADTVQLGEKLQIKGDQERRDQMERTLELRAEETLRQAEIKSKAMMEAARQEARELLETAQQAAEQTANSLIETAKAEEESIRNNAFEAGFQAGYEEGLQRITAETEAEVANLLDSAQTLLNGAFQAERRVLKAFTKDAYTLVSHVARRIVGDAFAENPELQLSLIERAVESLYLTGKVKIVMHPELLASLRRFTPTTDAAVTRMNRFEFTTDEQLDLRQIFVLSEQGHFELTPETQVDNLLAPVAKELVLPEALNPEAFVESVDRTEASTASETLPENQFSQADEVVMETTSSEADFKGETASAPAEYVSFDDLFFETVELDGPEEGV